MFFKPGKKGDKAFNAAWKEIQALARDGGKPGLLRPRNILGLSLLTSGTGLVWDLLN